MPARSISSIDRFAWPGPVVPSSSHPSSIGLSEACSRRHTRTAIHVLLEPMRPITYMHSGCNVVAEHRPGDVSAIDASISWRIQSSVRRLRILWTGLCRSEEHTSELQSLMRISYAVVCLKKHK